MLPEPFTITSDSRTWTRNSLTSAKGLADNIARQTRKSAVVTLTETGWVEYTAEPAVTRVVNIRVEKCDVYIGRSAGKTGGWGNPFSHLPSTLAKFRVSSREEAVSRFREWFLAQPELVARARRELRGKVLGCWCKPASCHGDVIAEIVDAEADGD